MLKIENYAFKKAGIKTLMIKNYGLSGDELDLNSLIDNTITMAENWYLIKPKVLLLTPKKYLR